MKNLKNSHFLSTLLLILLLPGCLQSSEKIETGQDQAVPAVVLGGGIAGLTAAVYLTQANIPTLVIEGPKPGGALAQSHSVRNWPGVLDAPGEQITNNIKKQAEAGGAQIMQERVISVDFTQRPLTITTQNIADPNKKRTFTTHTCIIATGTEPNLLGVPGETGHDGYWGRGVSNCAVCEGSLCKGKKVGIVGGGDAAIVEANYLADLASDVTIFIRKDHFRAKDVKAKDRALANDHVKVRFNTRVQEMLGSQTKLTSVTLQDTQTEQTENFELDQLFLAIGSQPNTALFKGQLDMDERGFLKLVDHQQTSVPGVYAAGDVADATFVQAVTASGAGCSAALMAQKYLEQHEVDLLRGARNLQQVVSAHPRHFLKNKLPEIGNKSDWQSLVINAKKIVLVDVYADMCTSCKAMLPVIEQLAFNYTQDLNVVKLNISSTELDWAQAFEQLGANELDSVPTFLLVNNGKLVAQLEGEQPKRAFQDLIDKIIDKQGGIDTQTEI
ncbi:MAG: FAD-dependent oxidoreductase [Epsilonproteobacteria bacterium]|nr:FAD-dependent oxidoreductase [Campylobacterota bacterium]